MKTVAFDFDGVIHQYEEGWLDGSIYSSPNWTVVECINRLLGKGIAVVIISTRDPQQIKEWVDHRLLFPCTVVPSDQKFWNTTAEVGITNVKMPAMLYVDDRGLRFDRELDIFKDVDKMLDIIYEVI